MDLHYGTTACLNINIYGLQYFSLLYFCVPSMRSISAFQLSYHYSTPFFYIFFTSNNVRGLI